jgi:hypothetical protein
MPVQMREPTTGPKQPTSEEMAMIVVAVDQVWPRPSVEEEVVSTAESMWKFANRWWGSNVSGRVRPKRPSAF